MLREALLVASGGGHLKQLMTLRARLPHAERYVFVTYESGLSQSLAEEQDPSVEVQHVPYASPRDLVNLGKDAVAIRRIIRTHEFDFAVSTGAGIAVAALPLARAAGIPSHYIESATRADGPSMTGKILARCPGISLYTQHPSWQNAHWRYGGSVFDSFQVVPKKQDPVHIERVVVVLGSMETYSFARLVHALLKILPVGAEVLWQTGATPTAGLPIEGRRTVPAAELEEAMRAADVVVAHAGTGTALSALQSGKVPVLVPREQRYGEHVDDHQQQTARELTSKALAIGVNLGDLSARHLERAASLCAVAAVDPPPLRLVERRR